MKRHVIVIGSQGQLGFDLCRVLSEDETVSLVGLSHKDIDITCENETIALLDRIHPHTIINTAAFHNLEEAEQNPILAKKVNEGGAAIIARYCGKHDISCVYISTDYVFGRNKKRKHPYFENSATGPINVYGQTKVMGEQVTKNLAPKHYILRTCGLYGIRGSSGKKRNNFVDTMIHFAETNTQPHVVDDQIVSPTYALHLAKQIAKLIHTDTYGTYHTSSLGRCSWYECAQYIFDQLHIHVPIHPVPTTYFPSHVQRPLYSVLSKHKLLANNLCTLPHWKQGIIEYLHDKLLI